MIVFGFSRGKSLLSACIRWFTDSQWSHCWLEVDCPILGGRVILHATDRGVVAEPALPKLLHWGEHVARFEVLVDASDGVAENANALGKRYDWFAVIVGHTTRLLAHKITGGRYGNPARDAARLTCSEYMALVAKSSTLIDSTDEFDPESMAPSDMYNFCILSEQFQKL